MTDPYGVLGEEALGGQKHWAIQLLTEEKEGYSIRTGKLR